MFERFTDRARRSLALAQEEARAMGHNYIGTEHLLLGLLGEGDGIAAKVLSAEGVELEAVRQKVRGENPPGPDQPDRRGKVDRPPFTQLAKRALEVSLREALGLGHNYIGTEHLLLGLLGLREGLAFAILEGAGVTPDAARSRVLDMLKDFPAAKRGRWLRRGQAPAEPSEGEDLSPALMEIMAAARAAAGDERPLTSGDIARAMVAASDSQGGKVLARLGVTTEKMNSELAAVPVESTTDAVPAPEVVISVAGRTTTVRDAALSTLLQQASAEEISEALRRGLGGAGQKG